MNPINQPSRLLNYFNLITNMLSCNRKTIERMEIATIIGDREDYKVYLNTVFSLLNSITYCNK